VVNTTREAALVDRLNAEFQADPLASESLGVHITFQPGLKFFCNTTCNNGTTMSDDVTAENFGIWADCRQSSMLVNMHYSQGFHVYHDAGMVYHKSVMEKAVRCSYYKDSGSRFRVNHGCGCDFFACKGSMEDACAPYRNQTINACINIDRLTGQKNGPTSTLVAACQCDSVEQEDKYNEACYWQGPAFFEGHGDNQIRKMVEQRLKHSTDWHGTDGHPGGQNSEVVIDEAILQEMLKQDFAGTIAAFFVVETQTSKEHVQRYLEEGPKKQYALQELPPLIGIDPTRADEPFYQLA
jgi:hypothetical protein